MKRLRLLPITDASATVPVGLCPRQCAPTAAHSPAGWLAAEVLNGHAAS
jgi:hypothetical protein